MKYHFPAYQANGLVKDNLTKKYGSGDIWFDPGIPISVQAVPLILPTYLSFELEINVKELRKSLNAYISDFREEKLTDSNSNYFGFSFTQKVFRVLLDRLSFRQSKKSILSFRSSSKRNEIDEFKEVFQDTYPKEFKLWQKQTYLFPLWETLLASEQTSSIEIHELMSSKILHAPQAKEPNLRWHAIDHQPLQISLGFRIVPKEAIETGTKTLEIIEVVKSNTDKYTVYLNDNHLHPLFFSKKTKLGHLLYHIAEDGYIQFDKCMEKTLEYVKDKRCKLWSKTRYMPKQFFEVDEDGYLLANLNISIRFLQKCPIK